MKTERVIAAKAQLMTLMLEKHVRGPMGIREAAYLVYWVNRFDDLIDFSDEAVIKKIEAGQVQIVLNQRYFEQLVMKAWNEDISHIRPMCSLSLSSIVNAVSKSKQGTLIKAKAIVWTEIVELLRHDWTLALQIPPYKWEELVAGAFDKAGFDKVVLTPRSGDHGRDVVATKNGIGSIKIIGSVKAYKPGHLVTYDDVRSLLGVMSGEHDASKGIITTTSDFPPNIEKDPFIAPFLPTRLELMNGTTLREWLVSLLKSPR